MYYSSASFQPHLWATLACNKLSRIRDSALRKMALVSGIFPNFLPIRELLALYQLNVVFVNSTHFKFKYIYLRGILISLPSQGAISMKPWMTFSLGFVLILVKIEI
jgi:hypothetical protein